MIDKHAQKILSYINSQCEEGSYKVITNDDLISVFNKKYKPTQQEIAEFIEDLKQKKFIVVKYKDETSFLLTSTNSGKTFSFSEEPGEFKLKGKYIALLISLSFTAGFLGSLLAGLILRFFG